MAARGQPAGSTAAGFQMLQATPIRSVYQGSVERERGHARFQHETGRGSDTQVGHSTGAPQPSRSTSPPSPSHQTAWSQCEQHTWTPLLPLVWEQTHHVSWYPGYRIRDVKPRSVSAEPTASGGAQ